MTPTPVLVAFRTLGCKVNRAESEQIAAELLGDGCDVVAEDEADVVIVNTCTVTGEADAKARKAIRQALNASRGPLVVVTGCLAALDPAGLRALGERVLVESDKSTVAARVRVELGLAQRETASVAVRVGESFRTRVAVKIEDGCDNFCTYCIVPYARGVPRGVPLADVTDEARALVEAGVKEIVLTGVNLGRYQDAGAGLADVVREVAATGVPRLRLSSIEPPDLTRELLDVFRSTPSICPHLHVPLQSGSDQVLGAMGRAYTTSEFRVLVEGAREALPGLAVTTDVIAGFPGETEEDHRRTLEVVREIGFAKLHVFRYSQRAGTPAASMEQVPSPVRARRAGELRALGETLRGDFKTLHAGTLADVLVESVGDGHARGTTGDYLEVSIPSAGLSVGDVVTVRLSAEGDRGVVV